MNNMNLSQGVLQPRSNALFPSEFFALQYAGAGLWSWKRTWGSLDQNIIYTTSSILAHLINKTVFFSLWTFYCI